MEESCRGKGLGVVVIGRNEGERLRRCLASLPTDALTVVYVDSGSTDGSVDLAMSFDVNVVELDPSRPLSAARARNAGTARLLELDDTVEFVQFVDGDCELITPYLNVAVALLRSSPRTAAVAGRLRERYPGQSVYNRLCDMEWDVPVGEARAVGGIGMFRRDALQQASGFNPAMIAGEEPELCLRLRRYGWHVERIDVDMGWHEAGITCFSQWWRRAARAGHAAAEGAALHGRGPERYKLGQVLSMVSWGLAWPLLVAAFAVSGFQQPVMFIPAAILLLALFIQWTRIRRDRIRRGDSGADATLYASFCLLGKGAGVAGIARYWTSRLLRRQPVLIEYKNDPARI